jgi:hypothetical protein
LLHRSVLDSREYGDAELADAVSLDGTVEDPARHARLPGSGLLAVI